MTWMESDPKVFGASGSPAPCKRVTKNEMKKIDLPSASLPGSCPFEGAASRFQSANSESKGDLPNKGDGALLDIRVQLFRKTYSTPTTHNLVTVKKVGARLIAVIFEEYHRLNDLSYLFDGAGLCERGFPPYIITQMYSWRCLPLASSQPKLPSLHIAPASGVSRLRQFSELIVRVMSICIFTIHDGN
ncbi:hypothetical protein WG66_000776 [Moniliophthora roreri]|nr:hypothetical protein WG66_000776 [Moniliophthora roreri]